MFEEQLEELRKLNKERNFTQTVDLFLNFDVDKKKKLNVSGNIYLPHGKGKAGSICVFADTTAKQAKELGVDVVTKSELSSININDLVDKYDSFLAETSIMLDIGKMFGPILAPKNKMPKPYPPTADLKSLISSGENNFPVKITKNVVHLVVGNENFDDKKLDENLESIMSFVDKNMPKGKNQIKSAYLKFTMSPTVRLI